MHAIRAAAMGLRWLLSCLPISRHFQQSVPQCDNAAVANTQVFLGAIDHRSVQVLLNRNVLIADTAHAGKVFAVLLLAIYKIVVLSIGDRLERARIDFAVGARPCNLALAIRERAPRAVRSGETNHPIGVPGPVQQSSSFLLLKAS